MLKITVPATEQYDESTSTFIYSKEQVLQLEHSLVSISKWESRWRKPFLSKDSKTIQETIDYIRCMTITQNVDDAVYSNLSNDNIQSINTYIEAEMTATTFSKEKQGNSREVVTAELIYYWMVTMNIPFECQKWHLNRLLTLINVINIKNAPPKKMSTREIMTRNTELNEARKKTLASGG